MRNVSNGFRERRTDILTVKSRKGMATGEETKGVLLVGRR
jgi:hypothetical protein